MTGFVKTHDSHVVITRAAWLLRFLRGGGGGGAHGESLLG